jgi:NAD(P)-dependent dehydrogenase (short-subunit alcohol dehydrogenase family)
MQEDGYERHYCTNFLQMCLFIDYLAPTLSASATPSSRSRIAVMGSFTSFGMAKGNLAFEHLQKGQDGPYYLMQEGGYPYAQTKLAQHVYCKHVAPSLAAMNVDINVACPGSVPSNTPGWLNIKRKVPNCMWGCVWSMVGARYLNEGAATIMHLCGAASMEGKSGKYADFGYQHRYHRLTIPVDLEFYPSNKGKVAPTTANPALRDKLYAETADAMSALKAKYA